MPACSNSTPPFPASPAAVREAGQPDFTHGGENRIDARGESGGASVTLDQTVTPPHLYLADSANNRVLAWSNAASAFSHSSADLTIGQPDAASAACGTICSPNGVAVDGRGRLYVSSNANNSILVYNSPFTSDISPDVNLSGSGPTGVAVDPSGNLYVANTNAERVIVFKPPFSTGKTPDIVIGGPCIPGPTTTSTSICAPQAVALDAGGRLYVAATANNRVLEYDSPLAPGTVPNRVFGQNGSFTSGTCNSGPGGLCSPTGVAVDIRGDLFIADTGNNRVLEFNAPLQNPNASLVFGQNGDFSTNTPNKGGLGPASLWFTLFLQPNFPPFSFGGGGVAADNANNLYVADNGNSRLLEFAGPFPTSTLSPTPTKKPTPSSTPTPTQTRTATPRPTATATFFPTPRPTSTRTPPPTGTPTRTPTPSPTPSGPFISSIPATIRAGDTFTINGLRFTHGSVVNFFVSTASGPLNFGPLTPSSFSATLLAVPVPSTISLGQGVAAVQVVNTDQGFAKSNIGIAQLFGDPAFGFPNLTAINGVGLAATSTNPSFALDNVETLVPQGKVVTLDGNGFDTVNGVAVDLFCACAGGKVGPFFLNPGNPGLTSTTISFLVPASGTSAPVTGPGSFVISNKGSAGTFSKKSNAVSVPIGQLVSVTSVTQSGTIISVTGTGFSTLTVINLFNAQPGGTVNLGGLKPSGAPNIPLTLVNSMLFTFTRPAAAVAGPYYVQAINPPFVPFASSDSDPGGAFNIK